MNYEEAIEYIHSTYRFGSKLGLDNISRLMSKLGNPQDSLNIIHVAGTNGKGSISAMIQSVLSESGYKTGFFISPYLERFTERIQIDNEEISKVDLAVITSDVKKAVDEILKEGFNHPTEFEIVTAMGFLYFFRKNVDFLVLEVGLGGRYDATNVIKHSLISIIASISLEHTEYLGDTVEKIAFEKAGIIKNNNNVVVYPQEEKIINVIKKQADEKGSNVYLPNLDDIVVKDSSTLSYKNETFQIKNFTIKFYGKHQLKNLLVAIKSLEILKNKGFKISNENFKRGIERASMPGRFEFLQHNPDIVIDVAHNKDGIDSFTDTIIPLLGHKDLVLFISMLNDKKPENLNLKLLESSKEIYTLTPKSNRAITSVDLKEVIEKKLKINKIIALNSYKEAVRIAQSQDKMTISAFIGSFYMVGEIRTLLKKL
ncbi:MAG: folylpolyglutamate synthase/dihydrofolate synthase family protein [Bacillota bacterium]|nr:folylpolyglutamate synthase/dihydrofolate synthase family protein [Bacillota bacterium]